MTAAQLINISLWVTLTLTVDHRLNRCWNRRRAPGPGSIFQQSFYTRLKEPPSPQYRHSRADLQFLADLLVLFTASGQEHNAATHRYTHGHSAPTRLSLQLNPTLA
jgi:hypothetical protein